MVQSNKKNIFEKALHFSRTHFWVLPALFFITSIFAVNVNAQVIQSSPSVFNLFNIGDPKLNELKYGCAVKPLEGFVGGAVVAGNRLLSGASPTDAVCIDQREKNGITDNTGLFNNYRTAGLYDYVTVANALVINERPASGKDYVESQVYALANPGKVSAQEPGYYYPGTGFSLQKPVQSFWGWSVNVTYGFLVILIIAIAFAIMFRTRLGGAASVTLQSAIPNIAIAMILVPLSYAITGLFIDGITLGTNVAHEFLMGPGAAARDVYEQRNDATNGGDDTGGSNRAEINLPILKDPEVEDRGLYADDIRVSWYGAFSSISVKNEIDDLIPNEADSDTPALIKLLINILDIFGGDEQGIDSWIAEIINFIVSVVLFLTGLRIFRLLIKKYITLLLNPIFSPFVFATIAIPGTGTKNIMTFLKQLGSASLFFIVYYTMALLSIVLTSQAFLNNIPGAETSGYIPPGLGLSGLLAGTSLSNQLFAVILSIAGIGVYLQIPKTLKDLDAKLGTDKSALMPILNDTMTSWKQSVGVGRAFSKFPGNTMDSFDRLRGREPGTYGSGRAFIRKTTSGVSSSLDRISQTSNIGAVRGLAGATRSLLGQTAGKAAGSDAAGRIDPSKPASIKASFKWNGQDAPGGFVSFSNKQIIGFVRQQYPGWNGPGSRLTPRAGAGPARIRGFSVDIAAENFALPAIINGGNIVVVHAAEEGPRTDTRGYSRAFVDPDVPGGGAAIPPFQANADLFLIAPRTGGNMSLQLDDGQYATSNGQAVSIGMSLYIADTAVAFGVDPDSGNIGTRLNAGGAAEAHVSMAGGPVIGGRRIFRISGQNSGPVRASFQMTPGVE